MNKFITFFLLILICQVTVFSQKKGNKGFFYAQYECVWSVNFIDDTIKMIQGREDWFILHFGEDLSYQYGYRSQQNDSIWNSLKSNEDWDRFFENKREELRNSNLREGGVLRNNPFVDVKLYKDYKTKKIKVVDHISTNYFIYDESLIPQNWEIQDDTTTIAGYACQKAVCDYRGRNYEAWFTFEIPISEGPWKFNGLPGLIIRLNDTQHNYEFELVEFKKINKIIDARLLTSNKVVSGKTIYKLTKIERKKLLKIQWGKQGDLIVEAEMAKVGLSHSPNMKKHDYIERDY
jgi:Protein of unknown function (Porph_ging).